MSKPYEAENRAVYLFVGSITLYNNVLEKLYYLGVHVSKSKRNKLINSVGQYRGTYSCQNPAQKIYIACIARCRKQSLVIVSCIFILLSRESDQCAIRARLGVASHLSTTPRWGNPAKCLSQRHK